MRKIGDLRELFMDYPNAIKHLIAYAHEKKYIDFSHFIKRMHNDTFGYDLLFDPFCDCMKKSELLFSFFDDHNLWVMVSFDRIEDRSTEDSDSEILKPTFTYRILSSLGFVIGDTFYSRPEAQDCAFNSALMILENWLIKNQ